ncbi:hypothetical protein Tco_0746592 [Tanacetum coccineum]
MQKSITMTGSFSNPERVKKSMVAGRKGMFLGYLIGTDGIKPCPDKTKAVIQLPSPRTMKEVQSLNGKLAGLNRFYPSPQTRSRPLVQNTQDVSRRETFRWNYGQQRSFHANSSSAYSRHFPR